MTPAERIAAALEVWEPGDFRDWNWAIGRILGALCPKGERVVLDRTGDTDRLIKQSQTYAGGWTLGTLLWVDVEAGAS